MRSLCLLSFSTLSLLAAPLAAETASLPERRAGLWEVVTVTEKPAQVPKISARMCIDRTTDRDLMEFGLRLSQESCARYTVTATGNTWTIDAHCSFGALKSTTRTHISGDFQARISMRMEGTVDGTPGAAGPQPTLITQESRWISEQCPGLVPGDVMLDGGLKINIRQMQQLKTLIPNLQIR